MNTTIYKPEYNNSWALVIGINEYRNLSPLGYARNDAEAVAALLKEQFGFQEKNVKILIDKAATKSAILKSFLRFADNDVGPDDRILVFFAGHGHTLPGRRGEVGYLVPVDGKPDDLSSLIRWDELTRNSELVHAKHILFIMDACYGGLAITRALSAGSTRFLKDMLQRYSRQVLTAGKADEVVSDSGGPISGHSVFTGHFLQALEGNAASGDGIITANGVMSYVYEKVSKDQHSRQTPHYGFLDGDGDFIFKTPILNSIQKDEKTGKDILVEVPSVLIEGPKIHVGLDIVEQTKEYISDERYRIKLDDLVTREIRKVLSLTANDSFPVQTATVTPEEFFDRLKRYESILDNLQKIVVSLSHWGGQNYISILRKIIARMADPHGHDSGKTVWLNLRWYPTIILIDVIGNKFFDHLRRRYLRWQMRRLCSPVASSMKRSEQSGWVLRSTSLTQRDRLTPDMACSTLTRIRDRARLCRLSRGLSSLPRGFF